MLTMVAVARRVVLVEQVGQMTFVLDSQRLRVFMHSWRNVDDRVTYAEAMRTKRRHIDKWRGTNRDRVNAYKRAARPSRAKE